MKFYERFDIRMSIEDAKKRFVNQVRNMIFLKYHEFRGRINLNFIAANTIGRAYDPNHDIFAFFDNYTTGDFDDTLHILENLYIEIKKKGQFSIDEYNNTITKLMADAPVDLGITCKDGQFYPAGAKLLDEKLVNDNLKWLSNKQHSTVLEPFKKGLRHLLHSNKRPELLADCVTDMYEAVEAMAKITTGKDKDLSGNKELFISKLDVSKEYKDVLKGLLTQYIDYGCNFRHAGRKEIPTLNEVENFIYLSGILIRAANFGG